MKKMPMLFNAEYPEPHTRVVLNELNPAAVERLVGAREVVATMKRDGTATRLDENGNWFARRMVREGKVAPEGFVPLETDPNTGKTFGWEPMENSPMKKFHADALAHHEGELEPGTYELVGPAINSNKDQVDSNVLLRHGAEVLEDFPPMENVLNSTNLFEDLGPFFADLKERHREGVVFWVDGAPAVKLRVTDFPALRDDDER